MDLRERHPRVLQPWYADDAAMEGRASNMAAADSLIQAGPAREYFPSPEKSIVLVRPADQAAVKSHLEGLVSGTYCKRCTRSVVRIPNTEIP
jgi:hypothetical protein